MGRVLVIGSQTPWIGAILLEKGARHGTTLEYAPIRSLHPNISVIQPNQLSSMFHAGNLTRHTQQFDAVITFSSLEHSGLGRYT